MDAAPAKRKEPEIVFSHLMEGIGLSLDLANNRMFLTDLGGSVYSANLDGSNKKNIVFAEGNLNWNRIRGTSCGFLVRSNQSQQLQGENHEFAGFCFET